jgi:hypothetical protein
MGTLTNGRFLVVGSNGYMRYRRDDGSWSNQLAGLSGFPSDMNTYQFEGVWAGADIIIVSGWYQQNVSNRVMVLWTCPLEADPETGANWTIHELKTNAKGTDAGLFDIEGLNDGTIRAVGARNWTSSASTWVREP